MEGVDYAALTRNVSLKAAFENSCKKTIAAAARTLESSVAVILTSGSVLVAYTVTLPLSSTNPLTSSMGEIMATHLVESLVSIPGIDAVVTGTISARPSRPSQNVISLNNNPDEPDAIAAGADYAFFSASAAALVCCMCCVCISAAKVRRTVMIRARTDMSVVVMGPENKAVPLGTDKGASPEPFRDSNAKLDALNARSEEGWTQSEMLSFRKQLEQDDNATLLV